MTSVLWILIPWYCPVYNTLIIINQDTIILHQYLSEIVWHLCSLFSSGCTVQCFSLCGCYNGSGGQNGSLSLFVAYFLEFFSDSTDFSLLLRYIIGPSHAIWILSQAYFPRNLWHWKWQLLKTLLLRVKFELHLHICHHCSRSPWYLSYGQCVTWSISFTIPKLFFLSW